MAATSYSKKNSDHESRMIVSSVTAGTGDYNIDADDDIILVNATAGALNVNLPDVTALKRIKPIWTIKKTDSAANDVVIIPNGSQKIDGAANVTLTAQYDYVSLTTDGSNLFIIAEKITP